MAEQFGCEGSSSTSFFSGESSDSNIELNIKTLDSRIFKFPVDRNVSNQRSTQSASLSSLCDDMLVALAVKLLFSTICIYTI